MKRCYGHNKDNRPRKCLAGRKDAAERCVIYAYLKKHEKSIDECPCYREPKRKGRVKP
jgi:hypothetical protein